MDFQTDGTETGFAGLSRSALYDPCLPILHFPGGVAGAPRRNQRLRRARILATIRRVLIEDGFDGVTVRRIADASGLAVQTLYNLVGPRDQAISEAICEYTRYVGRTASPRPEDPYTLLEIIDRWLQSVEAAPEFCRNVSLIFFSRSRHIFYAFRDREQQSTLRLLRRQQKCGALRPDADMQNLAGQLVLLASATCIEWADRPFSMDQLRHRLFSGYSNLLATAVPPPTAARRVPGACASPAGPSAAVRVDGPAMAARSRFVD